jgi:hypothetical protein
VVDHLTSRHSGEKWLTTLSKEVSEDDTVPAAVEALHKRFRDLQAATAEHAQLLNTSLDGTTAALTLVNVQLASLLARAS